MEEASGSGPNVQTGMRPLISAAVDDTNVYDAGGHKLGTVHSFHINRYDGRVEYAVLLYARRISSYFASVMPEHSS